MCKPQNTCVWVCLHKIHVWGYICTKWIYGGKYINALWGDVTVTCKLFIFSIFWFWPYLMKVIPETCREHWTWYLWFYYSAISKFWHYYTHVRRSQVQQIRMLGGRKSYLRYLFYVCLRIVVSNTYCVVFLHCFSSSCVPYFCHILI
jgi:hypothetical protein